jgi:hypothetical protein
VSVRYAELNRLSIAADSTGLDVDTLLRVTRIELA